MSTVVRPGRDSARPEGASLPILVVEDHEDCAASLAELLEFCGYSVRVAPTARDALAGPTPAIVVTELRLPDMDGYDLVRRLRERAGDRPMLVVAVSSRQRDDDRRPGAGAGVDLHLPKPADPRELLAALTRFSTGAAGRG